MLLFLLVEPRRCFFIRCADTRHSRRCRHRRVHNTDTSSFVLFFSYICSSPVDSMKKTINEKRRIRKSRLCENKRTQNMNKWFKDRVLEPRELRFSMLLRLCAFELFGLLFFFRIKWSKFLRRSSTVEVFVRFRIARRRASHSQSPSQWTTHTDEEIAVVHALQVEWKLNFWLNQALTTTTRAASTNTQI